MDIDHLKTFVSVASKGGFTAAALSMGESQSLVSKRVASLERELGVRLFERTAQGTTLTPEGKLIIKPIREMLDIFDDTMSQLDVFKRSQPVHMVVKEFEGHRPSDDLILAARPYLSKLYPRADVDVRDIGDEDVVDEVRNGAIDLALLVLPDKADLDGVRAVFVAEEPLVAIVGARHPLAQREVISLSDLGGSVLWVSEGGNQYFTDRIKEVMSASEIPLEYKSMPWVSARTFYNTVMDMKAGVLVEMASAARSSIPTVLSACKVLRFSEQPMAKIYAIYKEGTENRACVDMAQIIARIATGADMSMYW